MADHRPELPQPLQSLPSLGAIVIYLSGKPVEWWAGRDAPGAPGAP